MERISGRGLNADPLFQPDERDGHGSGDAEPGEAPNHMAPVLRHGGDADPRLDSKDVAAFLIEAYEGALIRMKVDGGSAPFDRFRRFALDSLPASHSAPLR